MRFGGNLCSCQMFSCDSQAGDLSGLTINYGVPRIWDFWIWISKIMKNVELSGKVIVGSLGPYIGRRQLSFVLKRPIWRYGLISVIRRKILSGRLRKLYGENGNS